MRRTAVVVAALARGLALGANTAKAEPLKIRIGWVVAPAEVTPYMFAKKTSPDTMG